jgi:hypothetical protein
MPRRRQSAALSLIAILAILAGAATASIAGPAEDLAGAQASYDDQEYESAIAVADQVIAGKPPKAVAIEALRLKAFALAVLGRDDEAASAFVAILAIAPRFELPEQTSPRILAVFRPARSRWELGRETALREELGADLAALELEVDWPASSRGGRPLELSVRLGDPKSLIAEVAIHYRRRGHHSFSRLAVRPTGSRFAIAIPGDLTASRVDYQLEAYAVAVHSSGVALKRVGSRENPMALALGAGQVPRPTPIVRRWWFIASAAAVALAVPLLIDQAIDVGPQRVRGRVAP